MMMKSMTALEMNHKVYMKEYCKRERMALDKYESHSEKFREWLSVELDKHNEIFNTTAISLKGIEL